MPFAVGVDEVKSRAGMRELRRPRVRVGTAAAGTGIEGWREDRAVARRRWGAVRESIVCFC